MNINIAKDGPSGAGKSTLARAVAKRLGYIYIDTGAMYRTIGFAVLNADKSTKTASDIISMLPEIDLKIQCSANEQQIFLNGENVTEKIRTPEISTAASEVSIIPEVREKLLSLQRETAANNNVIMDGRDIGAEILPNAQVKVFLTTKVETRAKRRFDELVKRGMETTFDEVLADMKIRDEKDSTREISPLRKAKDAVEVDTTELDFEQSVEKILDVIEKKTAKIKPKVSVLVKLAKGFIMFVCKFLYFYSVTGRENIPKNESFIACSNHNSYMDPVMMGAVLPRNFAFMAKEELFKIWGLGWLIRKFNAFPVKRGRHDVGAIKAALQILKKDKYLIMFPEGGTMTNGKRVKGKTGAVMIAIRAKVKVLPVSIKGTYFPFKKMRIHISKPLDLSEYYDKSMKSEDYQVITERLMNEIYGNL